jgi:hypothetical protein
MACSIHVSSVAGTEATPGGALSQVVISGTVQGCKSLVVEIHDTTTNTDFGPFDLDTPHDGPWSLTLQAGADFDPEKLNCDDKIVVVASCKDDKNCHGSLSETLPCGNCPTVTLSVEVGACDGTNRQVTLQATISGGPAQIGYQWEFGDGQNGLADVVTANPVTVTHAYPAPGPQSTHYVARFHITSPLGCPTAEKSFDVQPCQADCPQHVTLRVARVLRGGRFEIVDPSAPCLAPGLYRVSLAEPSPSGLTVSWSIDGTAAGTGSSVDVTLAAGETIDVSVAVSRDGCPTLSRSVELVGCTPCPSEVDLEVFSVAADGRRTRVVPADHDCLPPGRYIVQVTAPTGGTFSWSVDGVRDPNASGHEFAHNLGSGEQVTITAATAPAHCPVVSSGVTLRGCQCPDDVGLTVFDAAGRPVDPSHCVEPGDYRVVASGADTAGATRQWSVNGQPVAGNGSEEGVTVDAPVKLSCAEDAPPTTVSLTVSSANCPTRTAAVTLSVCARFVMSVCCEILDVLLLVLAGLTLVAVALWLCPEALIIPELVVFFTAFGWIIALVLLLLFAAALAVWFLICKPDWCFDILPLLWQIAFIAAVVFIYFGSCPACHTPLLPIGILLMLVFAALILVWILNCRPSRCQVVWELLKLGFANTLIGLIESAIALIPILAGLGMCISPLAVIFLWLINAFLDGLLMLLPFLCGFNPRRPVRAPRG